LAAQFTAAQFPACFIHHTKKNSRLMLNDF
jgi:hypothetical protein